MDCTGEHCSPALQQEYRYIHGGLVFYRLEYMTINNNIWSFKFADRIRAWGAKLDLFCLFNQITNKLSNCCSGRTSTELRYPVQGQVFPSDIILILAGSVHKSSFTWPDIAPSVSGQTSEWLISPGKNEYITSRRHKQPWDQLILRYERTCGGKYARTCPARALCDVTDTHCADLMEGRAETGLIHEHGHMKHTFTGGPMRGKYLNYSEMKLVLQRLRSPNLAQPLAGWRCWRCYTH